MTRWLTQIKLYPMRFVKTLAIYFAMSAIGLSYGILGPTLLDLKTQVSRDLTEVSASLPVRAGGYAAGSFLMGAFYERSNTFLFTALAMGISGILTGLIAHIHELYVLLAILFINGCFWGAAETTMNMMLLHLWGKEIGPFMQVFTFFFGCGGLVSPLIAQPFFVEQEDHDDYMNDFSLNSTSSSYISPNYTSVNETSTGSRRIHTDISPSDLLLVYPYSIIAGYLLLNCLFLLIVWKIEPHTDEHPSRKQHRRVINSDGKEVSDDNKMQETTDLGVTCVSKEYMYWKYAAVILTMIFAHLYYGLELTFGSFLVTYVVEALGKSKKDGTRLTSLFWGTFTFWKLTTVFYIEYIGAEMNILGMLTVLLIGNVLLIPFASTSEVCLWMGVAVIGLGISSIWSAMFGYLEEHFPVTSKISGSLIVSACVGEFIFPLIISYFVTTAPDAFLWVTLFCSLALTLIFLLLMYVMRYKVGGPRKNTGPLQYISPRSGSLVRRAA